MKSYYQVLGLISQQVSQGEIDVAYHRLLAEHAGNSDCRNAIELAYETLSDPAKKAEHDRLLWTRLPEYHLPQPPSASGGSGLKWLGLLSLAIAAVGYYYSTRPKRIPQPTEHHISVPAPLAEMKAAPEFPERPDNANESPVTVPAEQPKGVEQTPVFPQSTGVAPRFVRPAKKAGFDAEYSSWAVYLVVGGRGRGSGVMVEPGRVLTNCHVVAGNALSGLVVVNSATREVARVDRYSKLEDDEDVCLLSVPGAPSHVAEWGRSESLDIEATTYTVSFPGNEGLTWSSGKLIRREYPLGMEVLMTSNYCRPGVSGGPLFNEKGLLVGITSAGRTYRGGGAECMSLTAETARKVLYKPMVPIALAPTQYDPAMLRR